MIEGISTTNSKNTSKKIGNIFTWVLIVLLVVIAAFLMYVFITAAIARSKDENPPVSLYTIVSPSMEPKIKVYDVVINIMPSGPEEIEVGDVITFHSTSKLYSARLITHRVIDIRELEDGTVEYQTQGDNNLSPDDTTVPYENIVGEVVFTIPQLGRLKFLLSSVGGWIIIILIPAIIIIGMDLLKLNKLVSAKNKVDDMNKSADETIKQEEIKKQSIREKLFKKYDKKINDKEPNNYQTQSYQQEINDKEPNNYQTQSYQQEINEEPNNYQTQPYQQEINEEQNNYQTQSYQESTIEENYNNQNIPTPQEEQVEEPKVDLDLIMSRIKDSEENKEN